MSSPNITWTQTETVINGTSIDASSATISCAGLSIGSSEINTVDSTQISDSNTAIPTSLVINSFITNAGIGEPFQFYKLTQQEITDAKLPESVEEGQAFGIRYWNKNDTADPPQPPTYIGIVWYYSSDGTNKGTSVISGSGNYPWSKSD